MIAWICDRCQERHNPGPGMRNKRPTGWNTVRRNTTSYLLCVKCSNSFSVWLEKTL